MRTIGSEHQTDTTSDWHPPPGRAKCWSCQAPNVSAPSYGRRGEGLLIGQDVNMLIWRIFPKRSNWSLEGKENILFTLTEKGTHSDWWYLHSFKSQKTHFLLRRTGDHFLTCLKKPKYTVWTKQSLFKAGCSSWLLASMRRIAGKCVFWELTPSAGGEWDGRFCYTFTHPSPGGSNFIIFLN